MTQCQLYEYKSNNNSDEYTKNICISSQYLIIENKYNVWK